jgi:hypothetical protein
LFTELEIRNFQSLSHVKLDLGSFTLLTGESSSGKTAVFRALQALASNITGIRFLTVGAKQASISLKSESSVVTLERSKGAGAYRILDLGSGSEETFTKLGGTVPPRVSEVLRLDPCDSDVGSINFVAQHDPPYLLKSTGSQIARVFGDLTNVSRILEAVREANRLKASASSELRTREADLAVIRGQVSSFSDLPVLRSAVEEADSILSVVKDLRDRCSRLSSVISDIGIAESVLSRAQVPSVPDISVVVRSFSEYGDAKSSVRAWILARGRVDSCLSSVEKSVGDESSCKEELHSVLVAAGKCPTCGSVVE